MFGSDHKSTALVLLRVVLGALMFVHGAARISNGTVDDFGSFLGSQGLPLGFYVAWAITLFELIGSVLLAVGFYTHIIAALFILELLTGVFLIHWREGWFVVGAGRNGIEYSVLLIVCLAAIGLVNYKRR